MKKFVILLIATGLTAVMVACRGDGINGGSGGNGSNGGDVGESYTLTIDGTAGGAVLVHSSRIAETAVFTYAPGTVVVLNAAPDKG